MHFLDRSNRDVKQVGFSFQVWPNGIYPNLARVGPNLGVLLKPNNGRTDQYIYVGVVPHFLFLYEITIIVNRALDWLID